MQVPEKIGKSRNTMFFQWFEAPEGRKVGSLKRRVRSQLDRWEMNNCTPLFWSQNVQNTPGPDHFWKLKCRTSARRWSTFWKSKCTKHTSSSSGPLLEVEMLKSARRCGAKRMSKSKCTKHTIFGPFLEIEMSKKCTPLWREAHFHFKMVKEPHVRATFGRSDVVSRGRRKGLWTLSKVSKTWGFCSISKNDGRRGTFEEDLQRCIFCGRCSTSHDLASLLRGRCSSLDKWTGKIAKPIGTRPSTLHSTFPFWRTSRRIASFLMLWNLKKIGVSQKCCVFDVVKLKNWGR